MLCWRPQNHTGRGSAGCHMKSSLKTDPGGAGDKDAVVCVPLAAERLDLLPDSEGRPVRHCLCLDLPLPCSCLCLEPPLKAHCLRVALINGAGNPGGQTFTLSQGAREAS